jgi:hypothetical protein
MEFKNLSFRLFIYMIILEIYQGIIYYNKPVDLYIGTKPKTSYDSTMLIFQILSLIFFIAGITFLIISILRKEEKNLKFYVAATGYSFLLLIKIILYFII